MLTPWKESYYKPRQHVKKQRLDFANKVHLVKAMVFPVVTYGWEIWTIKKALRSPVWIDSRSWWWTGRPGILKSMGLQRVGHDWAPELNWTDIKGEIDNTTIIVGSFKTLLTAMDRSSNYWTGTWWFRVDDERVKEVKRLIFPGLHSWLSCSRESAKNRDITLAAKSI